MYECDQEIILENGENLLKEEESNLFTITLEKKNFYAIYCYTI